MDENNSKKTSLGMGENVEALLCYLFGWVSGLVLLVIEKESRFVKFHAAQSLITFLAISILTFVARRLPFIGGLLSTILVIGEVALWVFLMMKAYKGEMYKLPIVGEVAEQQADKMMNKF